MTVVLRLDSEEEYVRMRDMKVELKEDVRGKYLSEGEVTSQVSCR